MIDVHIHVVPPNLPGVGALAPLLTDSPSQVATALRGEMKHAGVSSAFAMGSVNAGDDDPLGIRATLDIAARVPGLRAIGICDPTRTDANHYRKVEAILASGAVVALKCYLGYLHFEPAHPNYARYYELAAKYHLTVMFHTGDTYSARAKLKYAHPLGIDEVAVDHPDTRFLMCHLGNPWMTDAAEVIYKNANVWADLSGLLVGTDEALSSAAGREAAAELGDGIDRAIRYSERPDRFLYGTDWPLASMTAYRDFIRAAVPEEHHAGVFEANARALFRM